MGSGKSQAKLRLVGDAEPVCDGAADDVATGRATDATLSILIPTFLDCGDPKRLLEAYRDALEGICRPKEIICVGGEGVREAVRRLRAEGFDWAELVPVELSIRPDEDDALRIGLGRATGDYILTVPGWAEVDPATLRAMFEAIPEHDLVIGDRADIRRSPVGRIRANVFRRIVRSLFGHEFKDLFCRARLGRRQVFEEAVQFGVRQHFIPLLGAWLGFKVGEAQLASAPQAGQGGERVHFSLLGHFRAVIDLITLFITLKFLHRPLRFFGFVGMPLFLVGSLLTGYLVVMRLLGEVALADRPLLIFGVLLLVLGIQIIAIGLIGEIIIYSSQRRIRSYEIAEIVRASEAARDELPSPDRR